MCTYSAIQSKTHFLKKFICYSFKNIKFQRSNYHTYSSETKNSEDDIDLLSYAIKLEKKFRPECDSNPWSLRYRCNALPTELSNQLGASHFVRSEYTRIDSEEYE